MTRRCGSGATGVTEVDSGETLSLRRKVAGTEFLLDDWDESNGPSYSKKGVGGVEEGTQG